MSYKQPRSASDRFEFKGKFKIELFTITIYNNMYIRHFTE